MTASSKDHSHARAPDLRDGRPGCRQRAAARRTGSARPCASTSSGSSCSWPATTSSCSTGWSGKRQADLRGPQVLRRPGDGRRRRAAPRAIAASHSRRVHGNQSIMEAAAAAKGDVKILAVTVLTSLDRGDLDDLGFSCDVEQLVLSRARRALEAGCDGVVSSGLEAKLLAPASDERLLVVTPGIRPVENRPTDDQKRVGERRGGVRQWRRLHRGRAADPRCCRSAGRGGGDPDDHRAHLLGRRRAGCGTPSRFARTIQPRSATLPGHSPSPPPATLLFHADDARSWRDPRRFPRRGDERHSLLASPEYQPVTLRHQ